MHEPDLSPIATPHDAPSAAPRHAPRSAPRHAPRTLSARLAATLPAVALLAAALGCGGSPDASRASEAGDGAASATGDELIDPATVAGTEITEQAALSLFPGLTRSGDRIRYDPVAYVVLRPDDDRTFEFPEYPGGKIRFRTNNLGFREDEPTAVEHTTFRILVSGDSHTEGVVSNPESLANVLERLLNEEHAAGARGVEVINAGVGVTGPDNYLGMLRKQLPLKPDAFIAVLYAGNDFINALQIHDFRAKREAKPKENVYGDFCKLAKKRWPAQFPQGFNQALFFHFKPGDPDIALDAAAGAFEQIAALCREQGIHFVAAVLPVKPDVDRDDDATCAAMLQALELTPADFAVNGQLASRFAERLAGDSITCIDTTPRMQAAAKSGQRTFFWKRDHHLSVTGHDFVARELLPVVRALIKAPKPMPQAAPTAPPAAAPGAKPGAVAPSPGGATSTGAAGEPAADPPR